MKDNIKNLIYRNWHWLVFFILSFATLSFLIFQPGVWAFTDSGFYYPTLLQAKNMAWSKLGLFSNTDGFYFGFDNSTMAFSHLLVSFYQLILTLFFGTYLGQILFYFIYYFICFYFGLKLLKKLFPDSNEIGLRLGALFLTFNPFSLLTATLFIISYVYALFILFLYVFLSYLEKGKINYLTIAVFCGVYLLSYLRLIPIIILTFIFIILIFYEKKYFNLKRLLVFITIFIICASPFIVSNLPSFIDSENVIVNYQNSFSKYEKANYDFKSSFINSFAHPGGFTPSALSFFYNNRGLPGFADNFAVTDSFEFFKIIQIIFNIGLLIFALFLFKNRKNLIISFLICFIFLINSIGFFVNLNLFSEIHKTILGFLYNDYGFMQFAQSFLYTFLIVNLFSSLKNNLNSKKTLLNFGSLIIIYLLINTLPFLFPHYGFKKVSNIPKNYQQTFLADKNYGFSEATIFSPYHWLKFSWSPYYLDLNSFFSSKYKNLIIPNPRLVDADFINFYNQIYDRFDEDSINNLPLFNIKNVFSFHDVQDADKNIDTYQVTNLEKNTERINKKIASRNEFYQVENNENFTHYRFKNADDYDFSIYSPKTLLDFPLQNFYKEIININEKPAVLNRAELNELNFIKEINFFLSSPYVFVKSSPANSNKYYVKLNLNKNYPFLLQFNQMFSKSWTIYFINKDDWDKVKCSDNWQEFKITENSKCLYHESALKINDLKFINTKSLKSENHFKGNFIGNTFLINPADIPNEYQAGDELYLVIYFKKQLYYSMALVISLVTFILLTTLSIIELRYGLKN